MLTPEIVRSLVRELQDMAKLSQHPQLIRLLRPEEPAPAGAISPRRDLGTPIALCQALAMTRRQGKTLCLEREDHGCWNPPVWMAHVDCTPGSEAFQRLCGFIGVRDEAAARQFLTDFPRFAPGQYRGLVTMPPEDCERVPDVVLFNCDNNFQLRFFLMSIKYTTGKTLDVPLDPLESCMRTIAAAILSGDYRLAIPDPGDQVRALTGANESILAVPVHRLEELTEGCRYWQQRGAGYTGIHPEMPLDFPKPEFYHQLFRLWELE